jgi:hypothetical protein
MDETVLELVARIEGEMASEDAALESLAKAEGVDPVPDPSVLRPRLPEKGTSIGLSFLYARSLLDSGTGNEAHLVLQSVAERLNQAGYWRATARVVGSFLDRLPQQAAPLVARARVQGGEEAVGHELLLAAHRRLPGHGLLAWLTAESLMSRGDEAEARKIAAEALPELITEKNYDTAESALLLLSEDEGPETLKAICRALELLARQAAWDQFDNVFELGADLLFSERGSATSWPLIRELWGKHPDHDSLRPAAVRAARAFFSTYPEPEAMIRISEIDRPSQPPDVVLERVRRAERFPPGYFARHSGWGIGRIRNNDTEHVVIDFPMKPLHRITMATAEQALETFEPEDLRVLLAHDRAEVDRLMREDPSSLVVKALKCMKDGRGTADDIRKILVPEVMNSSSWTGWWKNARADAARDPRIDARRAYSNIFALAGDGEGMTDIHLPIWDPKKDVMKNLLLLDTFLLQHPEESDRLLDAVRAWFASIPKEPRAPSRWSTPISISTS